VCSALAALKTLRMLDLSSLELRPLSLRAVAALIQQSSSLKKINFFHNNFQHSNFFEFSDSISANKSLVELNFNYCAFEQIDLNSLLVALAASSTLKVIRLGLRTLQRSNMSALAGFLNNKSETISVLDLSYN
jgi:hypothetical protein